MAKYLRKPVLNKPKVNIPMCIAGVLFCLTMVSTYLVSGLFARYTTTGTGSDSARVIRFGDITITETGDAENLYVVPGVPIDKGVTVSFTGSESATYVFVQINAENWTYADGSFTRGGMTWRLADGWTYLDDNVIYRSLIPNQVLTDAAVIKDSKITVGTARTSLTGLPEIIGFRASVVQSNGFSGPEAAWASLESKGGAAG